MVENPGNNEFRTGEKKILFHTLSTEVGLFNSSSSINILSGSIDNISLS